MNILQWEQDFLSTKGRINRKIFILYLIFLLLFAAVIFIPATLLSAVQSIDTDSLGIDIIYTIGSSLAEIALLPSLFLTAKRLHDLNKSAVYMLLYFIPVINILLFFYLICFKGTSGDNRYGADPLTQLETSELNTAQCSEQLGKFEANYFSTEGRLKRKSFIHYILFTIMVYALFALFIFAAVAIFHGISNISNIDFNESTLWLLLKSSFGLLFILGILFFITFMFIINIPLKFLCIRRLHDINANGWWIILSLLIPLAPLVFYIFLICKKGTTGDNRYGADPLAEPTDKLHL